MAAARCNLEAFRDQVRGETLLTVQRARSGETFSRPFTGTPAAWGSCRVNDGNVLEASIPDDPYAAESVLRAAFHLVTTRAGGILIHASGVAFGEMALVAVGPSGAGKSTFAELALGAPGSVLLSDEIVALFPNGECFGTPFRSSLTVPGSPVGRRLHSLFTLAKESREEIRHVAPSVGVAAVLRQVYRSSVEPLGSADLFERVSSIVRKVGVRELAFRKDPAVAGFLSDWIKQQG